MLLAPGTPMLFQGQEFGASAPFRYFADHEPELAELVKKGRLGFIEQFPSMCEDAVKRLQIDPHDVRAFEECKLDFGERDTNRATYDLHKELLRLRREDSVFSAQRTDWLHGAVLGHESFVLRYATGTGDDRLVLVNLGISVDLETFAEPLLAPPHGSTWRVIFSTEEPRFGGSGTAPARSDGRHTLGAHSALVLAPQEIAR
jgi:maltooligosyltrehalose trehalohydrolase